jgi:uncharacterized membrane-anchored protein
MTTIPLRARRAALPFSSKVPEVTAAFWIIKVLATTVGETAADYLNETLGLGLEFTSAVMALGLVIVLVVQFRARRYVPSVYWLAVVLISVVGTLFSDNLVDNLGVPLWLSTLMFSILLTATYAWWFSSERTLSIHSILSTKREGFYWGAVLFAFALGTSAGHLIAEGLNLGYLLSLGLFAAAIVLVAVAYVFFTLNAVVAFWIAYVLTRPLGASTGDLLSQPVKDGGLGLGTTVTSVVFLVVILVLVIALSVIQRRRPTVPLSVAAE